MRSNPGKRARAFTRLELSVVAVLLTLAVGVLLPQVQRVRDSADRSQSQNNLRQLALAAQDHASDHGDQCAPHYGTRSRFADPGPGGVEGSFFFHVLPYVEQVNLYRQARDDNAFLFGWNVWKHDVATFRADADSSWKPNLGHCSYASNRYVLHGYPTLSQVSNQDGTPNTILLVEQAAIKTVCDDYDGMACKSEHEEHNLWANNRGNNFYPVEHTPVFDVGGGSQPARRYVPTAFQSSGLNVALFDGGTRTISHKISRSTWMNACMHDDGQELGDDF